MAFIDLKLILKTILLLVMLRYAALYALIIVVMLIFGVPTWLIIAIFIMPNFKKSEEQNLPPEPIKIRINRGLNTILLLLSIPIVFRIIILSTQGKYFSIPLNIGFFLFYILLILLYRKNQQRVRMKTNNCIKEEKRSETYKNGEENIAMILPKEENAQNDNTTMLNNERNVDL